MSQYDDPFAPDMNFLLATKQKLRFEGQAHTNLTVEQLWDLPLQTTRTNQSDLDGVGKVLLAAQRAANEDSLVKPRETEVSKEISLKIEVVKAIIEYKQKAAAALTLQAAKAQERSRLLQIKEIKQAASLEALSEAEIDARLAALGK